ncbi:MAG: hypothetical protein ACXWQQ_15515 [Pseudobdellovibrio sp.]
MKSIKFTKLNGKYDRVEFIDEGRVISEISNPKQGTLPHDLVHAIIESSLKVSGFINLMFCGRRAEMGEAADGEAWLAEAMVESVQGMLWSGSLQADQFNDWVQNICEQRKVQYFAISDEQFFKLKLVIEDISKKWKNLNIGESYSFEWS